MGTSTVRTLRQFRTTALSAAMILAATPAHADFNEAIENALRGDWGQVKFDLNVRYEYANTRDTPKESANALTARLRLGYLTPKFFGLQAFGEFEGNQDIGVNDYASSRNGRLRKTRFDVIQDPQDTELNRLWLSFDGLPDTLFKVGRQRIKWDNDRFIGNVGWRQLEQTFDSVTVENHSIPDIAIRAGYLNRVRTIFSTSEKMDSPIVNIAYNGLGFGQLTGYAYLLDYNERENFGKSRQTYGIRFDGSTPVTDNIAAHYTAEYAWQRDYRRNPEDFQVSYINLMAGATLFGITGKVAMEQLEGRSGDAFQTPLGTNHAFQGWADLFLVTPADGIRDINGELSTNLFGTKLAAIYHDFTDDTGEIDYGKEVDLLAVRNFGKHYQVLVKYARFFTDDKSLFKDTERFWIQGSISF